jgi:hypothetical protein
MAPEDRDTLSLRKALSELLDKPCWRVKYGTGTGSMLSMEFGKRIPSTVKLPARLANKSSTIEHGEIGIFIKHCSWRIEADDKVVCTSTSDNTIGQAGDLGTALLCKQQIISVDLDFPSYDLDIRFTGGVHLRVFCDQANGVEASDNYSIHMESITFVVGPMSQLMLVLKSSP